MAGPYYVDKDLGDDGNLGTSEGAGNAWETIDKAMNEVAAGDHVHVKASADYTETFTLDTVGTDPLRIIIEGYTTTPGDGGQVTIDGESTRASGVTSGLGASGGYYTFMNLTFENHTSHGTNTGQARGLIWINCHSNDNTGRGFYNTCYGSHFFKCTAEGNGSNGFQAGNISTLEYCSAIGNGGTGFYCGNGCVLYRCVGATNAGGGAQGSSDHTYGPFRMYDCTIDGDNKDSNFGVYLGGLASIQNTIVYDCVVGFEMYTAIPNGLIHSNNLVNSCTTAYDAEYTSSLLAGMTDYDVTGDPLFTDEDNDDFSLTIASPARNAGADHAGETGSGADIGAIQSSDRRVVLSG